MNDELLQMRNLGKTSALWLHTVGIHTAGELRRLGAAAAYRAVLARGINASRVLLYSIEGARVLILAEVGKPVAAQAADYVWYTAAVPAEDHCARLRR